MNLLERRLARFDKMAGFMLTLLSISLLIITWPSAVAQQSSFDEQQISLITSIEDAFCEGFDSTRPDINYSLPVVPPVNEVVGCCRKCKLDLDCVHTDSCCVQMFGKIPDTTTKLFCLQPQLRPSSNEYINSDNAYLMLKGCSVSEEEISKNDPMRLMCEKSEYFDNLDVKVPVTDINQGVTFINRYCAYCNGKTDRDIVYWEPEVSCKNYSLHMATAENVVVWISKTISCNLVYNEPSAASNKVQKCDNYISSCNVTGYWADYDSLIAQACTAYTAPYNNAYKNVFCFLCNTDLAAANGRCRMGASISVVSQGAIGPPLSFSALLRFRPKDGNNMDESPGKLSICNYNQIYDDYKATCRNITCYPPRSYQYSTCVSPFQTLSGVWYRFYIKLSPVQERTYYDIEPNHMTDSILRWMKNTSVPQNTVSIHLYLKPSAKSDDKQLALDYYLAQIDINIPIGHSVKASFIESIFSLENKTISLPRNMTDLYPSFIIAELQTVDNPELNYSQGHELSIYDSIQGEMLISLNGGNDQTKDNSKKEKQLHRPEIMIPHKVCPLVELSISEFEIEWFIWGCSIVDIDQNISRAKYIEMPKQSGQNKSIFVCKSLFVDIINALMVKYPQRDNSKKDENGVPQGMLSLVCTCLSVFCSLLTLTTYALFKELRTQPGINNIMLTLSLIWAQIMFQFGASQAENVTELGCKVLGVLVHFSWLMTIMWMNVCSLHMLRVFKSLGQKTSSTNIVKTTFAYSGYCIIISTIPIAATIAVSVTEYGEFGYGGAICYISNYDMVGFTFVLPVGVIIFTNLSLFLSVIIIITKLPKLDRNSTTNRNFAKIYIKLSTLTGLTWVFGFVFAFTGVEVLEYIFIVLNAGIGVFICLAFVCNKRVLKLFTLLLRPRKTKYVESTKQSSLGESTSRCHGELHS